MNMHECWTELSQAENALYEVRRLTPDDSKRINTLVAAVAYWRRLYLDELDAEKSKEIGHSRLQADRVISRYIEHAGASNFEGKESDSDWVLEVARHEVNPPWLYVWWNERTGKFRLGKPTDVQKEIEAEEKGR